LIAGFVFAFVNEGTDNRVRTPEDVRKATGYSLLTSLPARPVLKGANQNGRRAVPFFDNPYSHEAEALRELQTSILLSDPNNRPQVLLVVSPAPGDGKTTVAINLATALSNLGNTCLVDADLRRPGIAPGMGVRSDPGLNDVLEGSVQLSDALVESHQSRRLMVLPAGGESLNGVVRLNIDELLFSKRMRQVLRSLRYACQYVVIDSPPLIPYADARALSSLVDGVILVGRYGSKRQALAKCADMLSLLHAPVLGVVLNGADLRASEYQYSKQA
jgi:capsular exopolysaccharide synthesis family protein